MCMLVAGTKWLIATMTLDNVDHLASIGTAVIAAWFWISIQNGHRKRRRCLENYLKKQKETPIYPNDLGRRSIIHLMAALQMTEAEVYDAAFRSRFVKSYAKADRKGWADKVLLGYSTEAGDIQGN